MTEQFVPTEGYVTTPQDRANRLLVAANIYELKSDSYSISREKTLEAAEYFYERRYYVPTSLALDENALHMLMIADAYSVASSEIDREWLRKVAYNSFRIRAHETFLENRIKLPSTGDELVTSNINYEKTMEFAKTCDAWGVGTPLHAVRKNLGISPENQKSFRVAALNYTAQQLLEDYGGIGFADIDRKGYPRMILPKDVGEKTIQHEYVHTQSGGGVTKGDNDKLLFRAINEALTESTLASPQGYARPLLLLKRLERQNVGIDKLFRRAFMGDQEAWVLAMKKLLRTYGLRGLLYVATCAPDDNSERLQKVYDDGALVFVNSKSVTDVLDGIRPLVHPTMGVFTGDHVYPHAQT